MMTYYDFATGQIVDDGQEQASHALVAETTCHTTHLRLSTVDEATACEQRQRHFDHVIVESLIAGLDG